MKLEVARGEVNQSGCEWITKCASRTCLAARRIAKVLGLGRTRREEGNGERKVVSDQAQSAFAGREYGRGEANNATAEEHEMARVYYIEGGVTESGMQMCIP